ncbi:MAG TPA: AI-2E family transporter [Alphaproteobacteria bacterium]
MLWATIFVAFLLAVWLLSPVLFPFLVGLAIAYVLDPAVDRVERGGVGRTLATVIVMTLFFLFMAACILLLAPVFYEQTQGLSRRLAEAVADLYDLLRPYIDQMLQRDGSSSGSGGDGVNLATQSIGWLGGIAMQVWSGGVALFNILSLLFITPVVVFYLLRDWDRIVATVDLWLPRDYAPVIRQLLREIDLRLSGFLRGQALVCLFLGLFYAVGLTLVGLHYGLVIGLVTGLVSFVPYLGMLIGAGIGLLVAFFQFDSWWMIAAVAAVFLVGQFIEGNFVSPILVGDRVGLHPVWVMLAILAGGALFGVVGVLISVPVAAAIAVLLRFALDQYLHSPLYRGPDDAVEPPPTGKELP